MTVQIAVQYGKFKVTLKAPAQLEFDSESNAPIMAFAIMGLEALGQDLSPTEKAFRAVQLIQRPDLATDETASFMEQSLNAEGLASLQRMPTLELFQQLKNRIHSA